MKRSGTRVCRDLSLFLADAAFSDDIMLRLALARLDCLGSGDKLLLLGQLRSGADLAALSLTQAESIVCRRIPPERWHPEEAIERAGQDSELLAQHSVRFVVLVDPAYPPQLLEVYRPPFGLYVRGALPDPTMPAVGVVGTRVPTGRGMTAAYALSRELSESGICVVSGLARGIDSAAHRGALQGGGSTVAVLPGGIESVYPPTNRQLAASILEHGGGLVTEYPPYTEIQKYRFPERNRIIAGLARSCVVVEAPEKSGALITADHALTEGRDVFVHGACIGSSRNEGARQLVDQGAIPVLSARDIFREWARRGEAVPTASPEVTETRACAIRTDNNVPRHV